LTIGILFPIIRTFAPIIAGMVRMNFNYFMGFVFIGSTLWISLFVVAGYLIGSIPGLKEYLPYVMPVIILTVTIPAVSRIVGELKKASKEHSEKV
jgi:membrane-associated protein